MELKILRELNYDLYFNDLHTLHACMYGHLPIVKWLFENYELLPNDNAIIAAAKHEYFDILEWLEEEHNLLPSSYGVETPGEDSYQTSVEMLDWLAQRNIMPDSHIMNKAIYTNDTEIIDWMRKHGIKPKKCGLIDFESLYPTLIIPYSHIENAVAARGDLEMLKELEKENMLPSVDGATLALKNGHTEVVEWLKSKGIVSYYTADELK